MKARGKTSKKSPLSRPSRWAKRRYVTAGDVLADLPPPEIARKLRIADVVKKAAGAERYSDHLVHDALTLVVHVLAAKKILQKPSLIKQAQSTLERWISKQTPAPMALVEWRHILAGTPKEIASVAMSQTEEAMRQRSSSPLGSLLTKKERIAIYALFGKKVDEDIFDIKLFAPLLPESE